MKRLKNVVAFLLAFNILLLSSGVFAAQSTDVSNTNIPAASAKNTVNSKLENEIYNSIIKIYGEENDAHAEDELEDAGVRFDGHFPAGGGGAGGGTVGGGNAGDDTGRSGAGAAKWGRQPEGQAGTCGGRGVETGETGRFFGWDAGGCQGGPVADVGGDVPGVTAGTGPRFGGICYRWIRICCRIVRSMKRR